MFDQNEKTIRLLGLGSTVQCTVEGPASVMLVLLLRDFPEDTQPVRNN